VQLFTKLILASKLKFLAKRVLPMLNRDCFIEAVRKDNTADAKKISLHLSIPI